MSKSKNLLTAYDTKTYSIGVLDEEDREFLRSYGVQAAASESVMPNVYGLFNRNTGIYEYYTSNLASALSVQNALEAGIKDELEARPKDKGNLRSI